MKKLNGLIQLCGISTTALTLQFLKLYKNLTYHGRQLLETLEKLKLWECHLSLKLGDRGYFVMHNSILPVVRFTDNEVKALLLPLWLQGINNFPT